MKAPRTMPPRPGDPIRLSEAAKLAGMSARELKLWLQANERATGRALMLRRNPRGAICTTIGMMRLVFGDGLDAPDDHERLIKMESWLGVAQKNHRSMAASIRKLSSIVYEIAELVAIKREPDRAKASTSPDVATSGDRSRPRGAADRMRGT